jgi:hypothetical protein
LTGDGVDERLEQRWKTWRLHTAEPVCERSQVQISFRCSVPPGEIDTHPEETVNRAAEVFPVELRPERRRHGDYQAWRRRPSLLAHSQLSAPPSHHHNAAVGRAIPSVDRVPRAAA